jgi:hypothetical protein
MRHFTRRAPEWIILALFLAAAMAVALIAVTPRQGIGTREPPRSDWHYYNFPGRP